MDRNDFVTCIFMFSMTLLKQDRRNWILYRKLYKTLISEIIHLLYFKFINLFRCFIYINTKYQINKINTYLSSQVSYKISFCILHTFIMCKPERFWKQTTRAQMRINAQKLVQSHTWQVVLGIEKRAKLFSWHATRDWLMSTYTRAYY